MAHTLKSVSKPPRKPCLNQRNNALRIAYFIVKQTVGFTFALGALVALNGSPGATAQALPKTMKAIVAHEYGGPDVLKYEDVPLPEPKENEILVRVIAAGVNPVDGMIRSGMFAKYEKATFPIIPGGDIAGVVEKTGSGITKFKPGDPVYAYVSLKNGGGYAEYAIATEKEAAPKPQSASH